MPRIWQFGLVTGASHQHPCLRKLQPLLRLEVSIRTTQARRRHHEPPQWERESRRRRKGGPAPRDSSARRQKTDQRRGRREADQRCGRVGQEPNREPRTPGVKNKEYRQRGTRGKLIKTQLLFPVALIRAYSLTD